MLEENSTLEQIAEIQAENALLKRREQINTLLDNRGVFDREMRAYFVGFSTGNSDLAEIDGAVTGFLAKLEAQRQEGLRAQAAPAPVSVANEEERAAALEAQAKAIRAKLPPPPLPSLDEQIAGAQQACDWKESLRLNNLKSNLLMREMADGVKIKAANSPQLAELDKQIIAAEQAGDWRLSTDLKGRKSNLLLKYGLQAR